jgi:hypothetical protein
VLKELLNIVGLSREKESAELKYTSTRGTYRYKKLNAEYISFVFAFLKIEKKEARVFRLKI